jgi:hypothetical protein
VFEIYEEYKEKNKKYTITADIPNIYTGQPWTYGDIRAGFTPFEITKQQKKYVILPFTGSNGLPVSAPVVGGNITSVRPVTGYLKGHYRNVGDLTTGLQNSYFRGSKNTKATTIDGTSPIEVFTSNPNAIKVLPGKSSTEPIIGTDVF